MSPMHMTSLEVSEGGGGNKYQRKTNFRSVPAALTGILFYAMKYDFFIKKSKSHV